MEYELRHPPPALFLKQVIQSEGQDDKGFRGWICILRMGKLLPSLNNQADGQQLSDQ